MGDTTELFNVEGWESEPDTTNFYPKDTHATEPEPQQTTTSGYESLNALDEEPLPVRETDELPIPGAILGNNSYITDKPGGVEPGHLVAAINAQFIFVVSEIIQQIIAKQLRAHTKKLPFAIDMPEQLRKNDITFCKKFLTNHPQIAAKISSHLRQAWKKNKYPLENNLWLIKTDYCLGLFGKVTPPDERLAKTNRAKSVPKKIENISRDITAIDNDDVSPTIIKILSKYALSAFVKIWKIGRILQSSSKRSEANLGNIDETIGNDFFKEVVQFNTQDQRLIRGTYKDGFPKIETICKWAFGLRTFNGQLAGSTDHPKNYANYLVKTEKDQAGNKKFVTNDAGYIIADDSLKHLGAMFAPLVLACDRDAIGSKGDNRGRIGDEPFIFDCGKTSFKDTLVSQLQDNFELKEKKKIFKKFKNFSLFYNTSFSEKMTGVFLLYKTLTEEQKNEIFPDEEEQEKIEDAIESYTNECEWFKNKIDTIKVGGFNNLFDKYIAKMHQLKQQAKDQDNKVAGKEYENYANHLMKLKNKATTNLKTLLSTFRKKLQLTKQEATILDNFEKATNETTLLSPDKKVKLQHLVYPGAPKIRWTMTKDKDNNLVMSTGKIAKKRYKKFITRIRKLNKSIKKQNILAQNIKLNKNNNGIQITLNEDAQKYFSSENNIIQFKQRIAARIHPTAMKQCQCKAAETIKENYDELSTILADLETHATNFNQEINLYFPKVFLHEKIRRLSANPCDALLSTIHAQHHLQMLLLNHPDDIKSGSKSAIIFGINKLQTIVSLIGERNDSQEKYPQAAKNINLLHKIYACIHKLYGDLQKPHLARWRFKESIQQEIIFLEKIATTIAKNNNNTQELVDQLSKLALSSPGNQAKKMLELATTTINADNKIASRKNCSLSELAKKHEKFMFTELAQLKQPDDKDKQQIRRYLLSSFAKTVRQSKPQLVQTFIKIKTSLNQAVYALDKDNHEIRTQLAAFYKSLHIRDWEFNYGNIEASKCFNYKAVAQLIKWQYQLQYLLLHNLDKVQPAVWNHLHESIKQLKQLTNQICAYAGKNHEHANRLSRLTTMLNKIYKDINALYQEIDKNFLQRSRSKNHIRKEIAKLEELADLIIMLSNNSNNTDYPNLTASMQANIQKYLPTINNSDTPEEITKIITHADDTFVINANTTVKRLCNIARKQRYNIYAEARTKTKISLLNKFLHSFEKSANNTTTNITEAITKSGKQKNNTEEFIRNVADDIIKDIPQNNQDKNTSYITELVPSPTKEKDTTAFEHISIIGNSITP